MNIIVDLRKALVNAIALKKIQPERAANALFWCKSRLIEETKKSYYEKEK